MCPADCPVWDHVVQLFACCQPPGAVAPPPCKPCQTTPWLAGERDGRPGHERGRPRGGSVTATGSGVLCGPELGRWITPFRWSRMPLERRCPFEIGPCPGPAGHQPACFNLSPVCCPRAMTPLYPNAEIPPNPYSPQSSVVTHDSPTEGSPRMPVPTSMDVRRVLLRSFATVSSLPEAVNIRFCEMRSGGGWVTG